MDTYKATITGSVDGVKTTVELDIQDVSDSFQSALAVHEFPYRAGAMVENMGQKARSIKFKCFFWDASYENHKIVLKLLDDLARKELHHPKYGLLKGDIQQLDVRHDDRLSLAEIDITFLESLIPSEAVAADQLPGATEESFIDGQDEAADDFAAAATDAGAGAALEVTLEPELGIMAQIGEITGAVRDFVGQIEEGLATLDATMNQIMNPVNSIISSINYVTNLPGRIISTVAKTVERLAEAYNTIRNAPARFMDSLKSGIDQLERSFSEFSSKAPAGSQRAVAQKAAMDMLAGQIRIAGAQRCALEAAYAFKTDQLSRQDVRKTEGAASFDAAGNYLNPVQADPLMTVGEIESVLSLVMGYIQTCVDDARGMQSLKDMAAQLVRHVNNVKLQMEKITTVTVENTVPLHLLCLQRGLPYNAAERVLAINPQIKSPSFVSGDVKIYTA